MEDAILVVRGGEVHDAGFPGGKPACLAADTRNPSRLYCGTSRRGMWRSDDAGRTWHELPALDARRITAAAVGPAATDGGPAILYAGTEPSAIFRSPDGGDTWLATADLTTLPSAPTWSFPPRPDTHHVRWITPDAAAPGGLFVAIEAGALVRTRDEGATWQDRVGDGPIDTHTLVNDPSEPHQLYSAAGDGYFESDDGGASWQKPQDGLAHRYLWSVARDPRPPGLVVVSCARGPFDAHGADRAESYVYARRGREPWTMVTGGLPAATGTTVSTLAADPHRPGVFYVANNHGIFRSVDGLVWEPVTSFPDRFRRQRVQGLAVLEAGPLFT